jgi:hypothetical protein
MTETVKVAPKVKGKGGGSGFRPLPANERPCPVCGGPMLPGPNVTVCSSECAEKANKE